MHVEQILMIYTVEVINNICDWESCLDGLQIPKKFNVSIIYNVKRDTSYSYIPKPILAKLGNPKGLQFVIQGDKILVTRPD